MSIIAQVAVLLVAGWLPGCLAATNQAALFISRLVLCCYLTDRKWQAPPGRKNDKDNPLGLACKLKLPFGLVWLRCKPVLVAPPEDYCCLGAGVGASRMPRCSGGLVVVVGGQAGRQAGRQTGRPAGEHTHGDYFDHRTRKQVKQPKAARSAHFLSSA